VDVKWPGATQTAGGKTAGATNGLELRTGEVV